MRQEGVKASVVTYNVVLRAAEWPVALSLLEDMQERHAPHTPLHTPTPLPTPSCTPPAPSYTPSYSPLAVHPITCRTMGYGLTS